MRCMACKGSGLTLNDKFPLLSVATLTENLEVLICRTLKCVLYQSTIFPPLKKECRHSFRTSNTVITLVTTQIVSELLVTEYKKQHDGGYKLGCENTITTLTQLNVTFNLECQKLRKL